MSRVILAIECLENMLETAKNQQKPAVSFAFSIAISELRRLPTIEAELAKLQKQSKAKYEEMAAVIANLREEKAKREGVESTRKIEIVDELAIALQCQWYEVYSKATLVKTPPLPQDERQTGRNPPPTYTKPPAPPAPPRKQTP